MRITLFLKWQKLIRNEFNTHNLILRYIESTQLNNYDRAKIGFSKAERKLNSRLNRNIFYEAAQNQFRRSINSLV